MSASQTKDATPIELSVAVKAPPGRVFAALTDARELARWFPSAAQTNPRAGGAYRLDFRHAPEQAERDHSRAGTYSAFESGRRVAFDWTIEEYPSATQVEFTLTPEGDRTRVTLRHAGWAGEDEARGMHAEGWGFFLQNLKSVLEDGKDQRAAMGLLTPGAA